MLGGIIKNPVRTLAIVGAATAGMVGLAACGKEKAPVGTSPNDNFIQGTQDEPGSGLTRTDARRLGGLVNSKTELSYSDGTRAAAKYKELLPVVEDEAVARDLAARQVSEPIPRKLMRIEFPGHNAPVSAIVDAFAGAKSVFGDRATPLETLDVAKKGVLLNTGGHGDNYADGVTAAHTYETALKEYGDHSTALIRGDFLMNGTRRDY